MKWDQVYFVKAFRSLLLCLFAASVCACHYLRSTEATIPSEYLHYHDGNSTLIVLLHGLGGRPQNFVDYGTLNQILECNADVNVVGVGSHFGYYREGIIIDRLHQDIVEPALADGMSEIWFLGVSLGGAASLDYRRLYPHQVEAVILMAPYLGEWDELQAYVADPQLFRESDDSVFPDIWDSLIELPSQKADVTLAFGEDDDFNPQLQWLAGRLDAGRVISAPGGHRWAVWQELWPAALNRSGLCT